MPHYSINVQGDYLERISKARPVQAIAELIWNALDADATKVEVEIETTPLETIGTIVVRDNGHGIPYADASVLFSQLGGSWKHGGHRSKTKNRMLHGQEGKGRFKAFALGRVVDWHVIYDNGNGELFRYKISMLSGFLQRVDISDEERIDSIGAVPGVEVRISEIEHGWKSESETVEQSFTEIFALYLTDYTDVSISLQGKKLDPKSVIKNQIHLSLPKILVDAEEYEAELVIVEWDVKAERSLYLCDANGFPLTKTSNRFHIGSQFQFSAYLRSLYVSLLHDEGTLDLAEMNVPLQAACDQAIEKVKNYFKERADEDAQEQVNAWKQEQIYPYEGEPRNNIEDAERKIFNVVAISATKHIPDFSSGSRKNKEFQLRMLRQAMERNPEELQLILKEVLDLSQKEQKELAKLLEETTLGAIISASKMVADRLKFLTALEEHLFESEKKKHLKERSQLHRMLAENTWIFGEEFNLTVDDQSLTEVLRKHAELGKMDIKIDEPVKRIDGRIGIIDLMLSRAVPRNRTDELEHLVVELKAPKVVIGQKEINQIESYAFAVADDERFRGLKTRWDFWILSNELDGFAKKKVNSLGVLHKSDDGMMTIWAKTWSEIIHSSRIRLRFFQEKLQYQPDITTSLRHIQDTYKAYFEGVVIDGDDNDGNGGINTGG